MLIFIYGEDSYSAQRKLEVMRTAFKEKFDSAGMNLAEFSDKGIKLGDVVQAMSTPPFISDKRMVIVRGLLSIITKKADAKSWIERFLQIPDSTILILFDPSSQKKVEKNAIYKELSALADCHTYPFPALSGASLNNWCEQEAKRLGLVIDQGLLVRIAALVGNDLWQLSSELSKLASYANGAQITQEMVDILVRANFDDQMFAFVDACTQKQHMRAMQLLNEQRQSGATEVHLFSMLSRQVRLLIGARNLLDRNPGSTKQDLANEMGVHPFVAQKTLSQAHAFNTDSLQNLHDLLFSLDSKMKTGGAVANIAVDRVVAEMIS